MHLYSMVIIVFLKTAVEKKPCFADLLTHPNFGVSRKCQVDGFFESNIQDVGTNEGNLVMAFTLL